MHCDSFLVSAKFGTCTVVSVNETLVEAKICTFTLESTYFIFKGIVQPKKRVVKKCANRLDFVHNKLQRFLNLRYWSTGGET